jgi:DNA-binding SARP family transcriptional activator
MAAVAPPPVVHERWERLPASAPRVAIRSLGVFAVQRGDEVVPAGAWQSRKARDLLKLLVTRRGRPATREALIEALWPEQDPSRTTNRLSVALSTARAVLDPGHRLGPHRFIHADRYTVRLEREQLTIDVERFLEDAQVGLCLFRAGRLGEAAEPLERAEPAYTGDFLEEDLYEDWAVSLREEARAAYVAVASALAELADADGDHAAAIRLRLRVLERDPYDERAHLSLAASLVAAGRHGEARRSYRRYLTRMGEIGVEPAPFPPTPRRSSSPAILAVRDVEVRG